MNDLDTTAENGAATAVADAEPSFWVPLPGLPLVHKVTTDRDSLTDAERAEWTDYVERSVEAERRRDLLGIVDLGEVMESGATEPEMLVPNLVVKSDHHLVYGAKESAKTWIVLAAAGGLIRAGETVVWVDKEMGRKNVADRLLTLGASAEDVRGGLVYLEFPSMDCGRESRLLWATLLRAKRPCMVVVDAQTEVLADAGLNENIGTDIEKWSQAYMTPARRVGAATVMIDHTGHTEGGRAAGSRQKGAAAKVELVVTKEEPFGRSLVGRVRVKVTKNTVGAPIPDEQRFRIGGDEAGRFVFEPAGAGGPDPRESKKAENRRRIEEEIAAVLGREGKLSQNHLAGMVTGGKKAVLDAAKALALSDMSRVQVEPHGPSLRYWLGPPIGD